MLSTLKKDILAVLHSEECILSKHHSEYTPNLNTKNTGKDKEGMIHTYKANNIDVGTVSLDSVNCNIYIHDHTQVGDWCVIMVIDWSSRSTIIL